MSASENAAEKVRLLRLAGVDGSGVGGATIALTGWDCSQGDYFTQVINDTAGTEVVEVLATVTQWDRRVEIDGSGDAFLRVYINLAAATAMTVLMVDIDADINVAT